MTAKCCALMEQYIQDEKVPLVYTARYREYVLEDRFNPCFHSLGYCPWCQKKLPSSLRDKWFSTLEKEYGLEDPCSPEECDRVPKEFETEEWWIKRGLLKKNFYVEMPYAKCLDL